MYSWAVVLECSDVHTFVCVGVHVCVCVFFCVCARAATSRMWQNVSFEEEFYRFWNQSFLSLRPIAKLRLSNSDSPAIYTEPKGE